MTEEGTDRRRTLTARLLLLLLFAPFLGTVGPVVVELLAEGLVAFVAGIGASGSATAADPPALPSIPPVLLGAAGLLVVGAVAAVVRASGGDAPGVTDLRDRTLDRSAFDEGDRIERTDRRDVHRATVRTVHGERTVRLVTLRDPAPERDALDAALGAWQRADGHPGVADCYTWGHDRRPWYVTELVDGPTLGAEVDALDPDDRRSVVLGVVEAVAALHEWGAVHGDVRPANVTLAADGTDEPRPVLTDVGVRGRHLDASAEAAAYPTAYAAPQQYDAGYAAADERTDVYQCGVLALAVLSGGTAVDRDLPLSGDAAEIVGGIGVDDALAGVLERALAVDRRRRYDSAAEFRDDLRAAVGAA